MDATLHESEDVQTSNVKRIGVVATNQQRKEWGLAAAICAGLVERLKGEVRFWWHCDQPVRHFNLYALIADYGIGEYVELTGPPVLDTWLAAKYRECDLTLQVGAEGFGYGIFESLACDVPVLHGDYAGGASLMDAFGLGAYLIKPIAWRLEGTHNCLRPVYDPQDWVDAALRVLSNEPTGQDREWLASRVAHLASSKLGVQWQRWFHAGIGNEK